MKHCPVCSHSYPTNFRVCPQDNTALRETNEIEPGMVIRSKYQILERLGGGGMADVYRAKHLAFNEICAIKVVKASYADDTAFNNRFKGEAVLTRKLRHPNAIAVEDYDTTEDGRPYIVMEFVNGPNLRSVIDKEGALSVSRALSISLQVARALAAAHKLGITHRDIKPDNILITQDEQGNEAAKVLDFGIAKVKEGAFTMAAYTATRKGVVVGTPQYMSPEQARGKVGTEIDSRADIYSLGVVIYEMITGKLPFESDTPMGYCLEHLHTVPVPPREFAAALNIPAGLSKLVMKALEKDREKRFSTIDEMIEALQDPERWAAILQSQAATVVVGVVDETGGSAPSPTAPLSPAATQGPQAGQGRARVVYTPAKSAPVEPREQYHQSTPPAQAAAAAAAPARTQGQPAAVPNLAGRKKSYSKTITLVLVLVLAAGAGAYYWMSRHFQTAKPAPASRSSTTTASSPVQQPAPVTPQSPSAAEPTRQDNPPPAVASEKPAPAKQPGTTTANARAHQPAPVTPPPATVTPPKVTWDDEKAPQSPASAEAKRQARELVAVARVQMARADYASAISSYQQALRLDPSNVAANTGLRKARQARAMEVVQRMPLVPGNPDDRKPARERRARELATAGQQQIDGGDYAMAVRTFEQAVRLDPSNATAQAGLKKAQQAMRTEDEILQRRK
jgi:serine/threonine protein kinase